MARLFVASVLHAVQRRMLWLLLGCYGLAALLPSPGLRLRHLSVGSLPWPGGGPVQLTLPVLMLAYLLFTAGLGAQVQEIRHLLRRPALLISGLLANTAVPLLLTLATIPSRELLPTIAF